MKAAVALAFSTMILAIGPELSSSFDGTWKTETENAKLPEKPEVFLVQNGLYTCKSCVPTYSIKADGVSHPVIGNPYFDAATMTMIDMNTFQVDHLRSGKVISRGTIKIGSNGNSLEDNFSHSGASNAVVVTGHLTASRVANGPSGSESLSGAWKMTSLSEADTDRTFTLKTDGNILRMSRPSGQSFTASFSGEEAPYTGDLGITKVRVKVVRPNKIEETDLRDNLVVGVTTLTLSEDGKQLTSVHLDKLRGFQSASIANRQ